MTVQTPPASDPGSARGGPTHHVHIERSVRTRTRPRDATGHALEAAAMFGLGIDEAGTVCIVPPVSIPIAPGTIIHVTGPSGGGKSTILTLLARELNTTKHAHGMHVIHPDRDVSAPEDRPLIDLFGDDVSLIDAMRFLADAGLSDAFVMLRRPCQLSDGQHARLRLALAYAEASRIVTETAGTAVLVVDEFCAMLDRLTASAIARTMRRWVSRTGNVAILATTHEDILEPLEPDVLIWKGFGDDLRMFDRDRSHA